MLTDTFRLNETKLNVVSKRIQKEKKKRKNWY